jgi:hypothetical protein
MEVVIVTAVLSLFGGVAFAVARWSSDARRTRRVLRRARVVRIADLVDGQLACIVGRVELPPDGTPITSLMLRTECVAFDTETSTFTGDVSVSTTTTRQAVPFYVVDDTGRARIDAPQLALCNNPVGRSDRYVERVLEVGMRVRIVGSVTLDPTLQADPEHHYRESRFKATLTGTAKFPMLADSEP